MPEGYKPHEDWPDETAPKVVGKSDIPFRYHPNYIEELNNVAWIGDIDGNMTALWFAATKSECACLAPGELFVFTDGVSTRFPGIDVLDLCREAEKILIWVVFYQLAMSERTAARSSHASILIIDRKNSLYVISNPWGSEKNDQYLSKETAEIGKWVKSEFGASFVRDFGADACPRVQDQLPMKQRGWCVLWSGWWIHHLLTEPMRYDPKFKEHLPHLLLDYYDELTAFMRKQMRDESGPFVIRNEETRYAWYRAKIASIMAEKMILCRKRVEGEK
jgi:hypothetical protein